MSIKHKDEFNNIVNDILIDNKFKELDKELHHGITRYGHCIRVAKATYSCSKALKLDYKSATRAALLHDFFTEDDMKSIAPKENAFKHPMIAAKNAAKYIGITGKEANIIQSHMYPLSLTKPKYKESWLVSFMDKGVALYEVYRFKCSLIINIWAIFIFNMITMQK